MFYIWRVELFVALNTYQVWEFIQMYNVFPKIKKER